MTRKKEHTTKSTSYFITFTCVNWLNLIQEENQKTINRIISNGKRFLAYDIVKYLQEKKAVTTLNILQKARSLKEIERGKLHKIFKTSFDCVEMKSRNIIEQKIEYIHRNPCNKKWNLAEDFVKYEHSSAAFYEEEKTNEWISDYRKYY